MNVQHTHGGRIYNLTNDGLSVGDAVFPISWGRITGKKYAHHEFCFKPSCTGFPDEPHTILDMHHSDDKGYEVRTDKGYGPRETYFKITC